MADSKKFIDLENLKYFWEDPEKGVKQYIDNRNAAILILASNNLTTHSNVAANSSTLGHVKIGNNITVSSDVISLTKNNVTSALGYTPPNTNTTYAAGSGLSLSGTSFSVNSATSSSLGGVKIGSNISVSGGSISLTKTNVETALGYTFVVSSAEPTNAASNQITFVI